MTTISTVINQNNIPKINLLKIDAEGSELLILLGINDEDWVSIKQIVMEIHSKTDLRTITSMLEKRGFFLHVEEDRMLGDSEIYNLFAFNKIDE